jgi:hypothetical protein
LVTENLNGHAAGNGRYSQGDTYGPAAASSTRSADLSLQALGGNSILILDLFCQPVTLVANGPYGKEGKYGGGEQYCEDKKD